MHWLDRAISWVNPGAGLRRTRCRAAQQALLAYEAERSDRRMGGWSPRATSGNAEIGPALTKLRNNARALVRDNAYAKRIVREWAKRVVGTGITPRAATGAESLDQLINGYWAQWVAECMSDSRMNFYAAQKLIVRAAYESGECLVRLWDRRLDDGLAVPFQIQILESDFLDSSKTATTDSGYIVQGVEFNKLGQIQAFWLFGQHPGEVLLTSSRGLTSARIPARDILHHAELERPGDVRAVTRFAPIMNKLRDIDEYADAEIVRKKIEACFTALITQPEGPDGPTAGARVTDASGKPVERFEPGMVMYGAGGMDAKFMAPASSADFASHKKCELREVAVGSDVPYILMDDNLEAVNYSSGRLGLIAYQETVNEYRWNWFIPQVLDPVWRRFVDALFMAGRIPEANYGVVWDAPPFQLLDRGAEAEADRQELQIGRKTWPQLVGEQGNDPEQQMAEIERWATRLAKAGVTFAKSTSDAGGGNEKSQAAGTTD